MALDGFSELRRVGLFGLEAGDRVDGLCPDLADLAAGAAALDLHGLDGVREEEAGPDGADLQTADLAAAADPGGAGPQRNLAPGQVSQLLAQLLLVATRR